MPCPHCVDGKCTKRCKKDKNSQEKGKKGRKKGKEKRKK